MNRMLAGVALLTALAAAPAATAQTLETDEHSGSLPSAMSFAAPGDAVRGRAPSDEIFREGSGLGVSSRTYTEEDGSRIVRKGLIGNWPISRGLQAGVGLFSVTSDGRKQSEFKRDWTVKEVTPKSSNIAAVGMKLRF